MEPLSEAGGESVFLNISSSGTGYREMNGKGEEGEIQNKKENGLCRISFNMVKNEIAARTSESEEGEKNNTGFYYGNSRTPTPEPVGGGEPISSQVDVKIMENTESFVQELSIGDSQISGGSGSVGTGGKWPADSYVGTYNFEYFSPNHYSIKGPLPIGLVGSMRTRSDPTMPSCGIYDKPTFPMSEDSTLWPFDCVDYESVELTEKNGVIYMNAKTPVKPFMECTAVLEAIKSQGNIKIAVASVSEAPRMGRWFIDTFIEIYNTAKTKHLKTIENNSSVPFGEMLFFDDLEYNIVDANSLGFHAYIVPDGMKLQTLHRGLESFTNNDS